MSQFNQQFITSIIDRYRLELDDEHIDSIIATWIGQYDRTWIVKAIVESLHRGRYKIKSVDSILSGWQRTGKPSYNFPPEFEREILQDLPTMDDLAATPAPSVPSQFDDFEPGIQFPGLSSQQLNPEESAPFPHHHRPTPLLQPPVIAQGKAFSRSNIVGVRDSGALPLLVNSASAIGSLMSQTEADSQDHHSSITSSAPFANFDSGDSVNPRHSNSHPKFQLFHTLRAIVTPNHLQATELDQLEPPSYSNDLA